MEEVRVQCPWCFETLEIWLDPESLGEMIRDCEVCCRPWVLFIHRQNSRLLVQVSRGN